MIAWLISSFLLSLLGAGLYLIFRRHFPAPGSRKKLVYLILLGSLGLPLVMGQLAPFHAVQEQAQQPLEASSVEEYCHCQDPQASEKLLFEAARGYEFLLSNQSLIGLSLLVIAGLMLVFLGIKMAWLFYLSRGQKKEMEFEGYRFQQVEGSHKMPAGFLIPLSTFLRQN